MQGPSMPANWGQEEEEERAETQRPFIPDDLVARSVRECALSIHIYRNIYTLVFVGSFGA